MATPKLIKVTQRKRGRPRKSQPSESTPAKKKRGRPRKETAEESRLISRKEVLAKRLAGVEAYLNDGRPKCKLELLAIQRQINDLKTGHERGLYWDEDEAQRAVNFFKTLRHWKGRIAGERFDLPPWQEQGIITPLLGWYRGKPRSEGGVRRFTVGGIEIPKKNGKSTIAAGIGLFGLIADREQGVEVYSAATQRDQASIVFQ